MNNENDELDGISPSENSSMAEEFNPYSDFIDDNESSPSNVNNKRDDEATDEDDIVLPDFLKNNSPSEIKSFSENVSSNPARKEPDSHNSGVEVSGNSTVISKEKQSENSVLTVSTMPSEAENTKDSSGGNTYDKKEDIRFKPKVLAEEANKHQGGKPRILNKKFLLTTIVCVLGSIMVVTFLAPSNKEKSKNKEKPVAEVHLSTDYSSIAKKHSLPSGQNNENIEENQKENNDEIPPVVVEEKPVYKEQNINSSTGKGGGSSSSVEIPDTRNDALQAKSISGIKGLTSTQQSYSTDYQQTIAKNTQSTSATSSYSLPSKTEYMNNVLSAYSAAYGNSSTKNSYAVQNDQSGKNSFFKDGRQANNVGQGEWLNLNTLWQGSIFEAVLTSELNTDLPGEITARISKNIYSSQDGRYLLIPQNSVLYGTYNSSISYSQSRVQVAWNTLIRPDGYQIQLGNMNGTDAKGASGLKGFVNDHPMAYLKAIGLMSVFSIVNSEFQASMGKTQNQYVQNILANSQKVTNELSDKLIDRAMNVQPTIKIKAGTKINIVVNQNLPLPPVDNIEVTQPYHRIK